MGLIPYEEFEAAPITRKLKYLSEGIYFGLPEAAPPPGGIGFFNNAQYYDKIV